MIVVTGGAGFIGSALIWTLNQMGEKDILVVDVPEKAEDCPYLDRLKYRGYLGRDLFLEGFAAGGLDGGVRGVFHLGACSSTTETDADYLDRNNFLYTKALCRASLDAGARFINASSAATYGDGRQGYSDDHGGIDNLQPLNLYGHSKQNFDLWARDEGLLEDIVCLKYFNVYGPNEWHKGDMRSMVCKGWEQIDAVGKVRLFKSDRPEYVDGGQERDFIYVKDAVDMTLFFFDRPDVCGIYNVGTGQANNWNTLIGSIFAALEREPNIEYVDMPQHLKGKYQYHTQAEMQKLREAGYDRPVTPIAAAVSDYVLNHLVSGEALSSK